MKTSVAVLICLISFQARSQDTINFNSYEEAIQNVFGSLDSTLFPSGILINAAPYDPKMLAVDGNNADSIVQGNDWLFYYNNIYLTSKKRFFQEKYTDLWLKQYNAYLKNPQVNIGILNFDVHYMDDSAYAKGQVTLSGAAITPLAMIPGETIKSKKVFAASPFFHAFDRTNIDFYFPDSLYFSNDTTSAIDLFVDFDDGLGFRTIYFNQQYQIQYPGDGIFHPVIQLQINGKALFCKTVIGIKGSMQTRVGEGVVCFSPFQLYNETLIELPDLGPIDIVTIPKPGQPYRFSSGKYAVWLGCGNTQIRKPYLISAGFNPGDGKQLLPCLFYYDFGGPLTGDGVTPGFDLTWNGEWRGTYYETYNGVFNKNFTDGEHNGVDNGNKYLDKLREEGYDIIILQYDEGGDYIQNNAELFIELINNINNILKENGSKHELVVSGYSAGAVTTRYALAKMEKDFETFKGTPNASYYPHHRCRLWISVEGEYQGGNNTLAFQKHLKFWTGTMPVSVLDLLGTLLAVLAEQWGDLPTAIQLNTSSSDYSNPPLMQRHPLRTTLLSDFQNLALPGTPEILKGYPTFCRRVGISQGSSTGQISYGFSTAHQQKALEINTSSIYLLPTIYYRKSTAYFTGSGTINLLNYRAAGMILFYGLSNVSFIAPPDMLDVYTNKLYNDYAPGSVQSVINSYAGPSSIFYGSSSGINYVLSFIHNSGFAPTVSCLDLHHPVTGVPLNDMGDEGWLTDVSSYGLFKLNMGVGNEHPSLSWGFPHINYPTNKYQVTPFDAVWAVGTNYNGTSKTNHFHVEDPQVDMGYFMASVEAAPEKLFLTNRNITDLGLSDRYQAAFEARNSIISGYNIYGENIISTDAINLSSSLREHDLSEAGNFIVSSNTDVDFRAGIEVHLEPGFEALTGCEFHAFIQAFPDNCPNLLRNDLVSSSETTINNQAELLGAENTISDSTHEIIVYPNPNSGEFYIQADPILYSYYELYDIYGQMIGCGIITKNQMTVCKPGVYMLEIYRQSNRITKKVVVEK